MAILELGEVRRSYDSEQALRGVSVSVEPGEVLGLVGRSGAGKTTLLRIAAGLLKADGGRVTVFGLDPWQHSVEVKRRLGYVAESQVVPPRLSTSALIDLHRDLYPSWDRELERTLLGRLAIAPSKPIASLSKGEARKVLLLCAIAHRPELLILDEPAGGLDPAARREFLELSIELLANDGSTILFSSHHMTDVERIASRLVLIERGEKVIDAELATFQQEHCVAVLPAPAPPAAERLRSVGGFVRSRARGSSLHAVFRREPAELKSELHDRLQLSDVAISRLSLEEMFVAFVGAES
ncbi:MAG TPA: ABC transporter ATP-binding protein [Polyangiaceae bacterium]|nr:ABC transporter ATP-binding protein [Polyangiaceae bacterium]